MSNSGTPYPLRKAVPFKDWSPGIHYAQFQTVAPREFPLRRLYDFELLYVCHGELSTFMNGTQHSLTAGQLLFIPPGVYHQNITVGAPTTKLIGIHFDFFGELEIVREEDMLVDETQVAADKFALEAVPLNGAPLSEEPVYHPSPECALAMEQIVHEFAMRPLGYELVCRGLMLAVLAYLTRTQMSRRIARSSVHGERIRRIMDAMEERPAEPWSGKRIAELMHMHEDHTAKLFRQIAGMPPGEYLKAVRHREARRLLRETELSIESVGERVGYPDIHYFSRVFTANEGIPPSSYRKLSRIL